MSLKDNVDYVKKEISTEESFLESVFKVENFYKKYKKTILGSVAVVIVAAVAFNIKIYSDEQNLIAANEAFNKVLNNPEDKAALDTLKAKNEKLYNLALYSTKKSQDVDLDFFKELSQYTQAIKEQNIQNLSSVSQKQNFLLKDFSLFNKALIEAKNSQYEQAKKTLQMISQTSDLAPLSKILEHYLLSK